MNVRKQVTLFRFFREPNPLEEAIILETLDVEKTQNIVKGYLFSPSGFSNSAKHFAENRPVELVDKIKLEKVLSAAGV